MTINNPEYYTYRPSKLKVGRLGVNISDELNANLNLRTSEYMIVGEQFINHGGLTCNLMSLIVDEEGIAVNCSLSNRRMNASDYAVQLYGNTYLDGNLIVKGIISTGGTSNISGGSSNFWRYAGENNIYYNGNATLGNYLDSSTNTYTLNVSESANYNIDKAQIAIQNRQNSVFRMSILGSFSNSPVVMNTLPKVPMEFHVGRTQSFFHQLYEKSFSNYGEFVTINVDTPNYTNIYDAPHLGIDINGNVGIKTNYNQPIRYILRKRDPASPESIIYPEEFSSAALHVEGTMYACNILLYDYESGIPKNLDDIYIRRFGVSIPACNIVTGDFAQGTFTFRSNVSILGPIDYTKALKVYGHTEVTSNLYVSYDITAGRNIVGDSISVHNNGSFSNNVIVQNNVYFKANLYKQRLNPETGSNEWGLIQFDDRFFEKPTLSNIYYIGDGIATIGRLGVGADPTRDEINHQMVVTKRDLSFFELELSDKTVNGYQRAAFIGHPTVSEDFRSDGSLVFLTPGVRDNNYNNIYTNGEQNMYFYPGFEKRISQFRVEACNLPTFGVFVNKRVGIRTFSPTHELDVNGDIAVTGNYYIKVPSEVQPVKLGIWRDNDYSYTINGSPAIYKGIQYYNPTAAHVGVNTIPQPDYGMVVGGKLLSTQGYYTEDGNRLVPLFNSYEMFGKPTPTYETMYTNGRLGMGVLFPQATLHLRETRGSTILKLSQSTASTSTLLQFNGNHNEFSLHQNDDQNTFEIYQGTSNEIYNQGIQRPFLVRRTPNNTYQVVINSNINYAINKPNDVLLVNGNVDVQGNINIRGNYLVNGSTILIAGSQAQYFNNYTNPDNIYLAGENIYMNTNPLTEGAIFVGWGGSTQADFPVELTGTVFDKSAMYVRQKNGSSAFVAKYEANGYYCLTQFRNSRDNTTIMGITNRNAFYIGNTIDIPYITVQDIGGNKNTIGIGTNNPNDAKLQVYSPDQQTIAKFTHFTATPDTDDFVADITLEKVVNTNESYAWKLQGPNVAYQQKLQFIYIEGNSTSNEILCITKNGCIGIGNSEPKFAIDIKEMGDQGSIRMLQSDPALAKPQLLFQSGSNQYGADFAADYRMYAYQNNFYLDMQDAMIGEKVLMHFTSNNTMGIHQNADSRFGVSISGSLNVSDSIYINGRPFFSVGDSVQDLGTFIQGYNIFLNPEVNTYGGVNINSIAVSSNIFQINSGLNGNTGVFSSDYLQSLIHFRNTINPIGAQKRLWRIGASNQSFIMEYRSNLPSGETLITDQSENYARASELVPSETLGEFVQRFQGSIQLNARNPKVQLNTASEIGASNNHMYVSTSNFGIGTYQPISRLHVYNSQNIDSVVIHQTSTLSNIITIQDSENTKRVVVNANGNVGIGTTLARAPLEITGQVFTSTGTSTKPSYSFSSYTSTGIYANAQGLNLVNESATPAMTINANTVGVGTLTPRGLMDIQGGNTIINGGNVGIGTTIPLYDLHVKGVVGLGATILPDEVGSSYTVGNTTYAWKEAFVQDAINISDRRIGLHTTDKVQFINTSDQLIPIVSKSLFLDTINQNPVILTKDSENLVNLPMIMTSNTSLQTSMSYTPIVLEQGSNVVGLGTYTTRGFLHVYSSNHSTGTGVVITQKDIGDTMIIEGTNFIDKTYAPFTINITNDGKFSVGSVADNDARVTMTDNNYKTVLLLNQLNDYQDIQQFYHQNVLRSVVNYNGFVGIGTFAPTGALHVEGQTNIYNTNQDAALNVYGNGMFSSNLSVYGRGYYDKDLEVAGSFINDSDRRIKFNIQPIESALTKIKKLSGYTFTRRDSTRRETGVIAQEIQEVMPEAVFENEQGILGVAYGNLIGLLIEGIKELSQEVEYIKTKLEKS